VFAQRIRGLGIRFTVDNLTDSEYLFTQALTATETQRVFKMGRTIGLSFSFSAF